jgi:hypothetical protein
MARLRVSPTERVAALSDIQYVFADLSAGHQQRAGKADILCQARGDSWRGVTSSPDRRRLLASACRGTACSAVVSSIR